MMTPATKGATAKKAPASRTAVAQKGTAAKKAAPARSSAIAAKRPTATKKTATAPVKKAAPKKATASAPVKKSAPTAAKKAVPAAAKKAAPAPAKKAASTAAKKAAPATSKKDAPAPAKKAATAPAKKAAAAAAETPAVVAPPRTTFTPKPKPPEPIRPKIGPYAKDQAFLDEVKILLIEDRAVYQEQATSLRAEADSLALEREPGDVQFDEESGEGGTVTVDRERNLALSGQALLAVEEIDDALKRIVDKTYGYCERCFQPIPKPRLRALPYARLCVACKSGGLSRR
jgi:RNA polymerase-binding transcription factor DksA